MNKHILVATSIAVLLSGCASTSYQPSAYDASHSRAYNLAHAGGLVTGIGDASVPKDTSSRDMKDVAFAASGAINPQFGLSGTQAGLLNFAAAILGPKEHGERNSVIGWVPGAVANSADEAQQYLLTQFDLAFRAALKDTGAQVSLYQGKENFLRNKTGVFMVIESEKWNCKPETKGIDSCVMMAVVERPTPGTPPAFAGVATGPSYAFTSEASAYYHKIELKNGTDSHIPQDELYAAISKHLPKGIYLYLAPKKVTTASGGKIPFPYILDQGKPELFVVSK